MSWTGAHALWDGLSLGPPPADLLDGFDPDAPPPRSQFNVVEPDQSDPPPPPRAERPARRDLRPAPSAARRRSAAIRELPRLLLLPRREPGLADRVGRVERLPQPARVERGRIAEQDVADARALPSCCGAATNAGGLATHA